jgi:hypothetical protein
MRVRQTGNGKYEVLAGARRHAILKLLVKQKTAQSLFAAVAQALRVFREHDWSDDPPCVSRRCSVSIRSLHPWTTSQNEPGRR